jgi:hypothetical protein
MNKYAKHQCDTTGIANDCLIHIAKHKTTSHKKTLERKNQLQ